MGFLITTLVLLVVSIPVGLWLTRWQRQDRVDRLRDQARLKVIETQMAAMRATLRIQAAEHIVRQRMHYDADNPFANSTIHEEPEEWQWK